MIEHLNALSETLKGQLDDHARNSNMLMVMTRMLADLKATEYMHKDELANLEYSVAPSDGWAGKNAEAREIAKHHVLENTPDWRRTKASLLDTKNKILTQEAVIEGLNYERETLEIMIKCLMLNIETQTRLIEMQELHKGE